MKMHLNNVQERHDAIVSTRTEFQRNVSNIHAGKNRERSQSVPNKVVYEVKYIENSKTK